MAFFKEFKEFALKGNVMDMAVGVIIGGAFGKIVSSLVNDILMPPIGALLGNTDFSQLRLDISKMRDVTEEATHAVTSTLAEGADAVTPNSIHVTDAVNQVMGAVPSSEPIWWNYGAFIQQCVDFTILALCVFMMIKLMNKLMKKPEPAPAAAPAPSKEEVLLGEIRDLLKEQKK
ncbi:MAG: large conductance mechanosensitive channel protein MscL [Alistipes sp.]